MGDTMSSIQNFLAAAAVIAILSGCASGPASMHSKGDAIVIARHASWLHGGYGVGQPKMSSSLGDVGTGVSMSFSDFMGQQTSMGMYRSGTSAAGSLAGGIAAGAAAGILSEAVRLDPRNRLLSFKVLYEKDCSYDVVKFSPTGSPEMLEVWPGHMVRSSSGASVELARDGNGSQRYLSKTHACYKTWVEEWKKHVAVVRRGGSSAWFNRVILLQTWADVEDIPVPEYEWIN